MGRCVYLLPVSEVGRKRLSEVQDHLDRAGTSWRLISCDDVTNGRTNIKSYYVVDPMEGPTYQTLIKRQAKIYGCGAIITSLSLKKKLVNDTLAKNTYTFGGLASMAMAGLPVCFTNIRKEDRELLIRRCCQMGARVHHNMSTDVKYLVVGEVQSNKYVVASERGIKCVTREWVDHLWRLSVEQMIPSYPDQEIYNDFRQQFRCPIFYGLVVCCSNMSSDEKERLAKLVTQHGGTYQTQMERNKCTHLVLGQPGVWIEDSVRKGFSQLATLAPYLVEELVLGAEDDPKDFSATQLVDETELSDSKEVDYVERLRKQLESIVNIDSDADMFGEMRFFLSGYGDTEKSQIEACLRARGGYIFDRLSSSITHVLLNRENADQNPDVALYRNFTGPRPLVVDFSWIAESIASGDVPEETGHMVVSNITGEVLQLPKPRKKDDSSSALENVKFYLLDKDSRAELAVSISRHQGQVVDQLSKATYAITAGHVTEHLVPPGVHVRTVTWLRQCIIRGALIYDLTLGHEPLMVRANAFNELVFTPSGLNQLKLEWMEKVVAEAGGKLIHALDKRKTTHLITDDAKGKMCVAALRMESVSVNSFGWFEAVSKAMKDNSSCNVKSYILRPEGFVQSQDRSVTRKRNSTESSASPIIKKRQAVTPVVDIVSPKPVAKQATTPVVKIRPAPIKPVKQVNKVIEPQKTGKNDQTEKSLEELKSLTDRLDEVKASKQARRDESPRNEESSDRVQKWKNKAKKILERSKVKNHENENAFDVIAFASSDEEGEDQSVQPQKGEEKTDDKTEETNGEHQEKEESQTVEIINPMFLLTSIENSTKKALKAKISSLGGQVEETSTSSEVTMAIAGTLQRNEKTLIALASGRPVLPICYIYDSVEAGKWLDPKTYKIEEHMFKGCDTLETKLVFDAVLRWRQHFMTSDKLPFHDWNVAFVQKSPGSMKQFESVLVKGGATVTCRLTPTTMNKLCEKTTHILVSGKVKSEKRVINSFQAFKKLGAKVFSELVISFVLIDREMDETISHKKGQLSAYVDFLKGNS